VYERPLLSNLLFVFMVICDDVFILLIQLIWSLILPRTSTMLFQCWPLTHSRKRYCRFYHFSDNGYYFNIDSLAAIETWKPNISSPPTELCPQSFFFLISCKITRRNGQLANSITSIGQFSLLQNDRFYSLNSYLQRLFITFT